MFYFSYVSVGRHIERKSPKPTENEEDKNMMNWKKERLVRTKRPEMTVATIGLTILIGAGLYQGTKNEVHLVVDGKEQTILTHKNKVEQVIDMMGYDPQENYILPALDTKVKDGLQVIIQPAKNITVKVDGKKIEHFTTAKTVGEVLESGGVTISRLDQVVPAVSTELTEDLEIEVTRAFPVTVQISGKKQTIYTHSTTVADFLKAQNIQYDSNDIVTPEPTKILEKNDVVKIIRVQKITDVVEETIQLKTEKKSDSTLLSGSEKVIRQGKSGKVEKTYEIVKVDGKIRNKKLIKETIVKEMEPKIIAVGTKMPSRGDVAAKEMLVTATAYTPYCTGCSGTTATGLNIRQNPNMKVIAVDPAVIPLGTKVYVDGYGYAVAGDTGSAIKGNKIDILMPTKQEAYRWGVKTVKIRIVG